MSLSTHTGFSYGNGDGTSNTHTVIGTPVPFAQNSSTQVKGDYVAAGVGLRASTGSGTITLPAVPGGSTITKALLYWSEINSTSLASLGQGSINGHAITGANYGFTASPCWDVPVQRQIYNFVADVTPFALFGANSLTGFASGGPPLFTGPEPLAEGASLIVVYSNASSSGHQVDVYQGARTFDGDPIETLTMSGYTAVAGSSHTTWIVADGQPPSPPLDNNTYVNGVQTGTANLNGGDGNFWDTNTQDVTANVPPANTSIQVGTESSFAFGSGDCITWVGQVLSTPINATTFTVNKAYSPSGSLASVPVSVTCTSGSVSPASGNSSPSTPFTATNIGFITPASCSASETVPAGYIMTSTCTNVALTNNVPASCTITNTETNTTFTVNKVYSPAGPLTSVPVTVTCSSGIVTTPSGNAAPGSPFSTVVHKFNVTGSTCSASETTVPAGYIESDTCSSVAISDSTPASCTITNTETTTTFTVNKVYSPAGPLTSVPVTVTCTSGIVTTPSGTAAPGSPFSTVVHKFNVTGSTCTASETVPPGYSESDNCTNKAISNGVPASCTITNSLITIQCIPAPNSPCPVGGLVDVVTGGSSGSGSAMSWLAVLVLAVVAMGAVAGGTFAVVRKRS